MEVVASIGSVGIDPKKIGGLNFQNLEGFSLVMLEKH